MTVNRTAAAAAVCCAVLFVSACGGGGSATVGASATPTTATSGGAGGDAAGGARGFRFPGATGLLAQLDGTTLQVQGTDTQTAVTYSAKTTFTNTIAAKLSDIVVGTCVQARSARPTSETGGAAPTTAPQAATSPMVAASVEISPAVNGSCTAMGGSRFGGARPPGSPGAPTPPAGMPTSGRTRGPGAGGGFFGLGASGKVTAVNGTAFTIQNTLPVNGTATAPAPTTPNTRTVQTSAATTYTRTGAAKASALAVGLCVTALGKADNTGSIAATSIALRPAENGSCSSGFGGRGPGGMPASGGGTGA